MNQLLILSPAPDFTAWKTAFDAEAEARDDAGLNALQIWQDEAGNALVLLEVVNRGKAEAWLADQQARGRSLSPRFLRTA